MTTTNKTLLLQISRGIALASAIFVVLLGGLLAYNEIVGKVPTLVNSKEVVRLHDDLRKQPKNEELKKQIRQLDFVLRRDTFYRLQLSHTGTRALLFGIVNFLASAHYVRVRRQRPPNPLEWGARNAGAEKQSTAIARAAVACVFAMIGFVAVYASSQSVKLPAPEPEPQPQPGVPIIGKTTEPDFQPLEEMKKQWPSFRGWDGSGVSTNASIPLSWDAKAGANLKWKSPVPMAGMSSPVVWSNSIFLTGADKLSNCVFRFDADSGKLAWLSAVKVPGAAKPAAPQTSEDTSLAAPTAVTDGKRVFAIFPDGELAAFDFNGKQVWARNIGPLENSYGFAASLAIYQNVLMVQVDRGAAEENLSVMLAIDTRTGRELGRAKREVAASWASPVLVEVNGKPQVLTCASPFVIAYDPANGKELWRNKCLESDVAPSPIYASNIVVVVAPNTAIIGLHPAATGIVWKAEDGVPDATSPVSDGKRVFIVNSEGMLSCFDLQTGKVIWQHEYDDKFYASPTIAGNVMILLSRKGVAYLLEPGDAFKEIGKAPVGEECGASPVPVGKRLFIRSKEHLFCIEAAPK